MMPPAPLRRSSIGFWPRVSMIIGVLLFMLGFEYLYAIYEAPLWEYMGFYYIQPSYGDRILMWTFGVAPAIWIPMFITRPSHILHLLSYVFVYVPSIQMIYFTQRQGGEERFILAMAMAAGFAIASLCYAWPVPVLSYRRWSEKRFIKCVLCLVVVATCINLYVYRGKMRIVSFEDRYEHRLAMRVVESNFVADYAMAMVVWVTSPFFLALAMIRRNSYWFAIALGSIVIFYAMSAARGFALTIVYIPGLYYLVSITKGRVGQWLPGVIACSFGGIVALHACYASLGEQMQLIWFQRCFVGPGFMTPLYYEFFSLNPCTYGSHMKGISVVIKYPYDLPLPFLIGDYLGDDKNSANAHLWADGIASCGWIGILLMSAILSCVYWVIDSASSGLNPRNVALMIAAFSVPLANLGLPSVFLGGGLGIMICLLSVMPDFEGRCAGRIVEGRGCVERFPRG